MKLISALVFLGLISVSLAVHNFVYDPTDSDLPGPSEWGTRVPGASVCGSGRFQSPLNIISSFSYYYANFGRLSFTYTKDSDITVIENGQTAGLGGPAFADNFLQVSNVLNGSYVLANVAFHWGQSNDKGSEHLIDNQAYVGEIQFVHYSTRYSSLVNAVSSRDFDALAVVSVFLTPGRSSPKNLTTIINSFNITSGPMGSTIPGPLDLTTLLPANRNYYTYTGSLTFPNCEEVATWLVLANPIKISNADLTRLRKVPVRSGSSSFSNSGFNYRPTQPQGSRQIRSNFIPNNANTSSSASTIIASFALLAALVALATGF